MRRTALFLVTPPSPGERHHNDNHQRLPRAFARGGWQVSQTRHDQLSVIAGRVFIDGQAVEAYDLIWPVGLGPRKTFFDRLQIFSQITPGKLITKPGAYVNLHGKAALLDYCPETIIGAKPEMLRQHVADNPGEWVIKPLAGSFGRGVRRVQVPADVDSAMENGRSGYWMLQRYIGAIKHGETRTLVCGDQILGSYLRIPRDKLHANLAHNAQFRPGELSATGSALVEKVHERLRAAGVGFAAIDTVGGYLMEVNLANPGGLGTMEALYGAGMDDQLVAAITVETDRRRLLDS